MTHRCTDKTEAFYNLMRAFDAEYRYDYRIPGMVYVIRASREIQMMRRAHRSSGEQLT
jgi:hypothetical protein